MTVRMNVEGVPCPACRWTVSHRLGSAACLGRLQEMGPRLADTIAGYVDALSTLGKEQDRAEHAEESLRIERKWHIEARSALSAAEAREKALVDVLREVEWEGMHLGRVCCPSCGGLPPLLPGGAREYVLKDDVIGHYPDCRLARALSALPASEDTGPARPSGSGRRG